MYRDYDNFHSADFEELKGKTFTKIDGLERNSEQIKFFCSDGSEFRLTYYQDCCASCSIEDINGEVEDLLNCRVLLAEEVSSDKPDLIEQVKRRLNKKDDDNYFSEDSETWTFYKLSTIKGFMTIRWYGSSNGYYSETATFEKRKQNDKE